MTPSLRERFRDVLSIRLGLALSGRPDEEVDRAIDRAAAERGLSAEELLDQAELVEDHHPAFEALVRAFTVGETCFHRHPEQWDFLRSQLRGGAWESYRAWSAGCATGEEAWTLAALLTEALPSTPVSVLGTDINAAALRAARTGSYGVWSFRGVPAAMRDRFCAPGPGGAWEIQPALRERVSFAHLNLRGGGWPSALTQTVGLNLICCRNVLIYFGEAAAREVVGRLAGALAPGGMLMVSGADLALDVFGQCGFSRIEGEVGFFRRDDPPRESRAAPALPPQARAPAPAPRHAGHPPQLAGGATFALAEARRRADRGDLVQARQWAERAVDRDPAAAVAWHVLGLVRAELGENGAAEQALRRALWLDRGFAPAAFALGDLMAAAGRPTEAAVQLRAVLLLLLGRDEDAVIAGAEGMSAGGLRRLAEDRLAQSLSAPQGSVPPEVP